MNRLDTILGELVESERLNGKHAQLNREAIGPATLLRDLVDNKFPGSNILLQLDEIEVSVVIPVQK